MNRSLELALCFVDLSEDIAQTEGAKAWVDFQESGCTKDLSESDRRNFDELCIGFRWAGVQVVMWIDEIVSCVLEGFGGWYWFWLEFEDASLPIKQMANSLRKSIEKEGLMMFLVRHPKFKQKPMWQKCVFR